MIDPGVVIQPAPASDIRIEKFRQILIWPVQLTPLPETAKASVHWDRLRDLVSPWQEVVDEFTEAPGDLNERHYAEFVAFMPDVQRFLYGEATTEHGRPVYGASPIRVFRRHDIAKARVTLQPGEAAIEFDVARVELYFFYDIDVAILALEVSADDLTLAQAEDVIFRLGRAYPTSWDADGSGTHCCESVAWLARDGEVLAESDYRNKERYLAFVRQHRTPCIAAHWAFLLHPLALQQSGEVGAIWYQQLEYQRIPLLAYLAADAPHRIDRNDWIRLALAAPAGPPGSSPFAPGFLADFEARYCYDRFWDAGGEHDQTVTRILCSGHACIMVGEAGSPVFTNAETGILGQYRHQYFMLGLIAHFHRATLLMLRDRLVTAISHLDIDTFASVKLFKREIRQAHAVFLRFTHRYWFQEVSNQVPARDLFSLWGTHLGTDRLFAEVRDEVQDMSSYLDSDGLRRQANSVVRLTVVTFFGLIGTVATSFLGMNLIDLTDAPILHKLFYLLIVLVPVAVLTFYTAAKSKRLADFLETVADERPSSRQKLRAFFRVWQR